ncbi:hypothetical protein [Streptomyces avermitilis]
MSGIGQGTVAGHVVDDASPAKALRVLDLYRALVRVVSVDDVLADRPW